jgi:hypothetical protein
MTATADAWGVQSYDTWIRPASNDERAFVLDSWVKSYQDVMPLHARTYGLGRWGWMRRVAEWAIATTPTLVVTLTGAPEVVLGWCCGKPGLVHYCYVKGPARKQGLATELLEAVLGEHPSKARAVRMTHRPQGRMRHLPAALGWQWEPVTLEEIEA